MKRQYRYKYNPNPKRAWRRLEAAVLALQRARVAQGIGTYYTGFFTVTRTKSIP